MSKNDENILFFLKLGIIQALLQTLNEIFQNTKISTILYSVCVCVCVCVYVCVLTGIQGRTL